MQQNEMTEIIDGVFFQKLSLLLGNLQSWEKEKQQAFNEMYITNIDSKWIRLEHSQKEVKNQLLQFIKILNLQYSFLSRLKKQEKEVDISSAFPKFVAFAQKFNSQKNSMLQLSDFLGKFIGVTNYEYTEIRKIHSEANEIKSRYENHKSKSLHFYNQKKELCYSKKHMKKHFELSKILDVLITLDSERKMHEQTYLKMHNCLIKNMEAKIKMYKNITDNLEYITELYKKGFKEDSFDQIAVYYKEKHEKALEERKAFAQNEQNMVVNEQPYKELKASYYKLFDEFAEEITVGNWNISFINKDEQSLRPENKIKGHLIITFDHKILFYKSDTRQIFFEQSIEDIKVYPPYNVNNLELKYKKSKTRFSIEFQKFEQEDEFLLHCEKMKVQK